MNHILLLIKDIQLIFMRRRGVKNRVRLLITHLRIKTKQIFSRLFSIKNHEERILGFRLVFPDYDGFAHLWREIFISENYYFESDISNPHIVDVGSNIGMSVCFFKYLYPNSTILAFEPDPVAFGWLKSNIEVNNFKNVAAYNVALGAKDGIVEFYQHPSEAASGLNSTKESGFDGIKPVKIKVVEKKLSSFVDAGVDLLKIDVEGGEYDIFEDLDGQNKFKYFRRVFMEVHQGFGAENDPIPFVLSALERNKFRYAVSQTLAKHRLFVDSPLGPYTFMLDAQKV